MSNKYQETLEELTSSSKELKDIIEWFLAENNIDITKITKKEIDSLIANIKEEDDIDFKKFENLVKKMK